MSRTLVVPLDGSSLAGRAVPHAVALARAMGARLVLVRAPSSSELRGRLGDGLDPATELEDAVELVRAEGVQAEPYLYPVYAPNEIAGAIIDAAHDRQATMIVMSTHGRGGLGRWLFGSVADAVLRQSDLPVLLVPATCTRTWPVGGPRRILVPLDGSGFAEAALAPASELARLTGADILLAQAVGPPGPRYLSTYGAHDPEAEVAAARAYLDPVAARLAANGVRVAVRVEVGLPERAIAALAHGNDVDLVAMATHGYGGLSRFVAGSVATGLLQRASTPVLLVRPATLAHATPEERAPEAAGEPRQALELTEQELGLAERGLKELAYAPGHPLEVAEAARALLARLRQRDVRAAALQSADTTPSSPER